MARKGGKDRGIVEKPKGSGKWWVRLVVKGREKWYRCDNKSQAKNLYGRLKAEILEETYFPGRFKQKKDVSLRAWIARCLESSTNRGIVNERRYGRRWSLLLGKRLLSQITTEDLRLVQAKFVARGQALTDPRRRKRRAWTPATINRHFSFLRRALTLAVKDGYLDRNPMSGVKFFAEAKRTRFLNDVELDQLATLMQPGDWPLIAIAVETGLRRGEQFGLRWDQADMENGVLTIPLPKGGRTRHVPLTEGAKMILRSLDSFLRSPWIFPGLKDPKMPMDAAAFLKRAYRPALRRAGIAGACWHTLRHTAASRRVMAGVDLVAVKEILGHRDIQTTMRYAHLSPGHLREAVNKGSLFGTGSKTGSSDKGSGQGVSEVVEKLVRPAGLEPAALRSVV